MYQHFVQQIQIAQAKQSLQLCNIFGQYKKAGFPISELVFHNPEHMFYLGYRVGDQAVGLLLQVMQLATSLGFGRSEQDRAFVY